MYWLLLLSAFPGTEVPAAPQAATAAATDTEEGDEAAVRLSGVEVMARRGAAKTPPETELSPDEIEALGAYDIREALDRISSAYGLVDPPVVIINGRRVQNAGDYMTFPPDAMTRVELLPEQAAGLYGADPGRRVVNIVLKRNFQSREGQLALSGPTAGGRSSLMADIRSSAIANQNTSQIGGRITRDTSLRADERPDYLRDNPGSQGVTLRPENTAVTANMSVNRELGDWQGAFSAQARAQRDRSASRRGEALAAIRGRQRALNASAGANGQIKGWSVRGNLDGMVSSGSQEGLTDRKTQNRSIGLNLSADRPLFVLPAGPLTMDLGGRVSHSSSTSTVDGTRTERSADAADVRGGLSIPLLRAPQAGEAPPPINLGTASLNLSGSLRRQTGSGGGGGLNGALSWSPSKILRFNGSWARSYDAPSNQQLFDAPFYGTPTVVFDFATGQSVEILPLYGGNPDLKGQTNERFSLGVSAGPVTPWRLTANISYRTSDTRDGISSLPTLTPAVEAAFPERFQRDADGRLIGIDQRSINLLSSRSDSLGSNISFNVPFGGAATPAPPGAPTLRVSLNHTLQLKSTTTIRTGYPVMDHLAGDGGGSPLNELSATVDARRDKWTLNASARWREGYRTRRDAGLDGPGDLIVSDFTRLDLKLGYMIPTPPRAATKPSEAGTGAPRLSGLRLGFEIENLLDARPRARLGDGRAAPGYGRDDQDVMGRVARLTLRGRF
ncbi:TonB-dependent receptor domain-containing protein [Caulobacter endophyticus]|uniref:TonB-dependent receptor domain-containing protein n=1 Tax=Caulobacter endophyticus TaxID=2172652 RepID=UPI00240EAD98|nr:TonB-dependent receptor [Caulobacter endophyticus]MDG2530929.1 TonB-dependent receptor [Caulobacter endophyticus]